MVNESYKKPLSGECLPVALCSLSRACHKLGNEQYIVTYGTVPPVLPCPCSSSYCPLALLLHRLWAEKHLCAAGIEGTYKSCQYLSLDISSVVPAVRTCSVTLPLPSWTRLGLLPSLEAYWKIYFVCQRPDLCGFTLGGLASKPGSLRRVGNDVLIKLLICMLIGVQLKLILF